MDLVINGKQLCTIYIISGFEYCLNWFSFVGWQMTKDSCLKFSLMYIHCIYCFISEGPLFDYNTIDVIKKRPRALYSDMFIGNKYSRE